MAGAKRTHADVIACLSRRSALLLRVSVGDGGGVQCQNHVRCKHKHQRGANYFRDMGRCHTHAESAASNKRSCGRADISGVTRERGSIGARESGGLPHWLISPGRFWPRLRAHIDANTDSEARQIHTTLSGLN